MIPKDCKRLAEVDFPIAEVSRHAALVMGAAVVRFRVNILGPQQVAGTQEVQIRNQVVIKLRPESQPESLDGRVLRLLKDGPLSKAELSTRLAQKEVSGQLNKVIRSLLAKRQIEYTIPEKPNSRLQKYQLTQAGEDVAHALASRWRALKS